MSIRGGKRAGAGRRSGSGQYGESTAVVRIPLSQVTVIRDFLAAHRARQARVGQDNVAELVGFAENGRQVALPLYTSKVAAGHPAAADDHVDRRLNPSDYLIQNDSDTFFVRVRGDSMIDAGIFEDDILVVDRSRVPQVGDIVLAMLDGEFTVKTLGKSREGPRLLPANTRYPVIEVRPHQAFEVCGVVTGSMRKFK